MLARSNKFVKKGVTPSATHWAGVREKIYLFGKRPPNAQLSGYSTKYHKSEFVDQMNFWLPAFGRGAHAQLPR